MVEQPREAGRRLPIAGLRDRTADSPVRIRSDRLRDRGSRTGRGGGKVTTMTRPARPSRKAAFSSDEEKIQHERDKLDDVLETLPSPQW